MLLALGLATGCKKDDLATEEFEVQTQGRDLACGKAQVVVQNPARVAQVLELPAGTTTYLALNLDTALWVRKNQVLLLRIRQPTAAERSFICNAMGLAYPAFTVVSARVK